MKQSIWAIANQKGGVGKTVTAVSLGHAAARAGARVLLIDLDPQGNCADSMGLPAGAELVTWLGRGLAGQEITGLALAARENLYLLRSDKTTAALKTSLAGRGFVEYSIRDGLENHPFDLVILDCAPSLDVLHLAALVAADWLLIPTRLDEFAIKGVQEVLTTLAQIRKRGSSCQLAGILPTFYEKTTKESQGQLENLVAHFHGLVWGVIPQDVVIRESNRAGKTVWEYAPGSRAAGAYGHALERLAGLLK